MTPDVKSINIKNHTCYFFNDMVNIEHFDSIWLKIDKESYKNIDVYYIGYITVKRIDDYENIYNLNPLYLTIVKVDRFNEDKNGIKYLVFDSTGKNKGVLTKYTELWDLIKNEIETINGGKAGKYSKDFMKIKFDTDDDFPLNKLLKFPTMTIVLDLFLNKMINFIHKLI